MLMSLIHFAHNGVDHASEAEAAAHGSNDVILWVALALLLVAVVLFLLNKNPRKSHKKKSGK
jgi:hypothetical protein